MRNMRYWSAIMSIALMGGFLIVESQAFEPTTASWIAFAVAIAVTVVALSGSALAATRKRRALAVLPTACALIGVWTIVAMNVFSPLTEKWLAFASGAGILALAVLALALHELTVERVVHSLDVTEHPRAPGKTSAPEHDPTAPLHEQTDEGRRDSQHA